MLTALVLSMAVAAPVPPPAPPVAGGPAPRVLELKPDASGKVTVAVTRTESKKVTVTTVGPNGAQATQEREVPMTVAMTVELTDVKGLKVTTADGKKVEAADAVKAVKGGAVVVVSSDGNPVSPNFLKAFKDDVLVLVSPELVPPAPPARPPVRPLPGQIRVQPLPANGIQIQVVPAVPAQPVEPAPAPKK